MELPIVEKGKFIIVTADIGTGIILNNDGTYYLNKGDNHYEIIEGKSQVIDEINRKLNDNQSIEILLYDHNGNFLEHYENL